MYDCLSDPPNSTTVWISIQIWIKTLLVIHFAATRKVMPGIQFFSLIVYVIEKSKMILKGSAFSQDNFIKAIRASF